MSTTTLELTPLQSRWNDPGEAKTLLEPTPISYLAPQAKTYYRSKAFISNIGINPLTAASAPLFFLVEQIKSFTTCPDITQLHEDLMHEIKAFEHQAQARNYPTYVTLAAQHALSLWIDETILNTAWGKNSRWEHYKLAKTGDLPQDNPFFLLLSRCLQNPTLYIDLLELFYLCLSFGFQGDYRHHPEGLLKLAQIREQLFDTIDKQRDQVSKQLEINTTLQTTAVSASRCLWRPIFALLTLAGILGSYFILDAQLAASFSNMHSPVVSTTAIMES